MLEFLSQKDKERIKETKQAADLKAAQAKARSLAQTASSRREQTAMPDPAYSLRHLAPGSGTATARASNFKPFAKDPEKQRRYEEFLVHMKKGQKGGCWPGWGGSLSPPVTGWKSEHPDLSSALLVLVPTVQRFWALTFDPKKQTHGRNIPALGCLRHQDQ